MVLFLIDPSQFLPHLMDRNMADRVLLGPPSSPLDTIIVFDLELLYHAGLLELNQISSKNRVHGLELGNFLIAEASGT